MKILKFFSDKKLGKSWLVVCKTRFYLFIDPLCSLATGRTQSHACWAIVPSPTVLLHNLDCLLLLKTCLPSSLLIYCEQGYIPQECKASKAETNTCKKLGIDFLKNLSLPLGYLKDVH